MRCFIFLLLVSTFSLAQNSNQGWFDTPYREYKQFEPRYIKVSKEENGLADLHKAVESIMEIRGLEDAQQKRKYSVKDAEKWLNVIKEHQADFNKLITAAEAKHLQPAQSIDITDSHEEMMSAIAASKNLAWLAKIHLAIDDKRKCLGYLKIHFSMTEKLYEADGSLIEYLVASACYSTHLQSIYTLMLHEDLTPADLKTTKELFIFPEVDRNSAKRSLNYEFKTYEKTLRDVYNANLSWNGEDERKSIVAKKLRLILLRIFFQPNKSIKVLSDHTEILQKTIHTPVFERSHLLQDYTQRVTTKLESKLDLFSFNQVGKKLLQLGLPPVERQALEAPLRMELRNSFIQTIVALKAYQLEHNQLPESLDSLTPKYIDALPNDPYSGKPLNYNPTLKILWSVGKDFQNDNGGNPNMLDKLKPFDDLEDQSDPTILIPF